MFLLASAVIPQIYSVQMLRRLIARAGNRYFFGTGGIGIRYLKTGHSVSVFRYFPYMSQSVLVFRYRTSVFKEKTYK